MRKDFVLLSSNEYGEQNLTSYQLRSELEAAVNELPGTHSIILCAEIKQEFEIVAVEKVTKYELK